MSLNFNKVEIKNELFDVFVTVKMSFPAEFEDVREYIEIIRKGENLVLLSPGGTGKTYIMKKVYEFFQTQQTTLKCALTSSTGISAVNMGGVTIHHWGGVGIAKQSAPEIVTFLRTKKKYVDRWRKTDYLFIDEISMIGGSFLDKLDEIGRRLRGSLSTPFGGLKIFASGDSLQLPPVNDNWFFQSKVWNEMDMVVIRNYTPYRYPDEKWFNILMRIREGKPTKSDIKKLKSRVIDRPSIDTIDSTILYPLRKNVDVENYEKLDALTTPVVEFKCVDVVWEKGNGRVKGDPIPLSKCRNPSVYSGYSKIMDETVPQVLELKVGAKCIITSNIDVELGLCNGRRCVIEDISEPIPPSKESPFGAEGFVVVLIGSTRHTITKHGFSIEDDDVIFSRAQIPLKIAYALTIHKSQGMTLDSVCTSISSGIFCAGQAYVALSRCKTLEGLYLLDFNPKKIFADSDALHFETNLDLEDLSSEDETAPS